jgi:hypothetical protein
MTGDLGDGGHAFNRLRERIETLRGSSSADTDALEGWQLALDLVTHVSAACGDGMRAMSGNNPGASFVAGLVLCTIMRTVEEALPVVGGER